MLLRLKNPLFCVCQPLVNMPFFFFLKPWKSFTFITPQTTNNAKKTQLLLPSTVEVLIPATQIPAKELFFFINFMPELSTFSFYCLFIPTTNQRCCKSFYLSSAGPSVLTLHLLHNPPYQGLAGVSVCVCVWLSACLAVTPCVLTGGGLCSHLDSSLNRLNSLFSLLCVPVNSLSRVLWNPPVREKKSILTRRIPKTCFPSFSIILVNVTASALRFLPKYEQLEWNETLECFILVQLNQVKKRWMTFLSFKWM